MIQSTTCSKMSLDLLQQFHPLSQQGIKPNGTDLQKMCIGIPPL